MPTTVVPTTVVPTTIWPQWVLTTSTTSTTYQTNALWQNWTTGTTTGTYWTNGTVWQNWSSTNSLTMTNLMTTWAQWNQQYYVPSNGYVVPTYVPAPPMTAEQRTQARRRQEEVARMEHERRERQRVAHVRARCLLDATLSDDQRHEMETTGHFHVVGSRGRRYRIRCSGQSGNVEVLNPQGAVIGRFCAHPVGLPDGDAWLAQMLALETDEDAFLRVANLSGGSYPADFART